MSSPISVNVLRVAPVVLHHLHTFLAIYPNDRLFQTIFFRLPWVSGIAGFNCIKRSIKFVYYWLNFHQDGRAMGITCSTDYARHYKRTELAKGTFICSCRAVSNVFSMSIKKMTCNIHVSECPIWSFWYNLLSIASIWREKTLGYLFADIICSEKGTIFRERSSRQTDNVQGTENVHIYAQYGGYCVYYSSNIFRTMRGFENWGISLGYSSVLVREYSVMWHV